MNQLSAIAAIAVVLFLAAPAHAGDPERGLEKSSVCHGCHGRDGDLALDDTYPVIAGQHYDYLVRALKDYRSGKRNHAVMSAFARNLTDQDIRDLAAWYASREGLVDLHAGVR